MTTIKDIQELAVKKAPEIKAGDTVRVHQIIKEGEKERVQIFEGLILKLNSGYGADKTFTVRKVIQGIGVEKIFPIYSPMIKKIERKKTSKIRRSKLYYMRERSGKSARLKESFVSEEEIEDAVEELAEQKAAEEVENSEVTETNTEVVETSETSSDATPEEKADEPKKEEPVADAEVSETADEKAEAPAEKSEAEPEAPAEEPAEKPEAAEAPAEKPEADSKE